MVSPNKYRGATTAYFVYSSRLPYGAPRACLWRPAGRLLESRGEAFGVRDEKAILQLSAFVAGRVIECSMLGQGAKLCPDRTFRLVFRKVYQGLITSAKSIG